MSAQVEEIVTQPCGHQRPADCAAGDSPLRRGPTIDLHCHLLNPKVEALVAEQPQKMTEPELLLKNAGRASFAHNLDLMKSVYAPKLQNLSVRLDDMDQMGVDVQAISPSPTQYYYWADRDLSEVITRETNENIAAICAKYPTRFIGFGSVSLQEPKLAAEQVEQGVCELGLRGFEISTLVNGLDIADPTFEPFWIAAEKYGAVVFIHPLGTSLGQRLDQHYLSNIIGQPLETTIALSQMIFSGLFDRRPGLKVCAAHGGGYLPTYVGRSDHGRQVRPEACGCQHPPSEYLRRIWFDTVVYSPDHLRRLIDQVGVGQIVIGTDYPFDMGDYAPHELIEAVSGLTDSERRQILGENAATLLGVDLAALPLNGCA